MKKIPKQEYTPEFRELAVKRVKAGQSIGAVSRELGLSDQTLRNWVKATTDSKHALTMAWFRRKPAPGVIHHSDRGSQYSTLGYAPPEKFLKDWFSTQHEQQLAA